MRLGTILSIALVLCAAGGYAEEKKAPEPRPATVDDATWATMRALVAERATLHAQSQLINVEFQGKTAELQQLVDRAAATAGVDGAKCQPDPINKRWVPRPGKEGSCLKEPPKDAPKK